MRDKIYNIILDIHPRLCFINHNYPCFLEGLRSLISSAGPRQLQMHSPPDESPLGLAIIGNTLNEIDRIRASISQWQLFYSLSEFRDIAIVSNSPADILSIDGIGIDNIATQLQAMGDVLYLSNQQQVCIKPQRVFDLLADLYWNKRNQSGT